jgi:hypothetical protein
VHFENNFQPLELNVRTTDVNMLSNKVCSILFILLHTFSSYVIGITFRAGTLSIPEALVITYMSSATVIQSRHEISRLDSETGTVKIYIKRQNWKVHRELLILDNGCFGQLYVLKYGCCQKMIKHNSNFCNNISGALWWSRGNNKQK